MSVSVIVFGASGDLARRKIYPALFNLYLNGGLPASFAVVGSGLEDWSRQEFRERVKQSLYAFSRHLISDPARKDEFLSRFYYSRLDADEPGDYASLRSETEKAESEKGLGGNRLFYFSVAPALFGQIARHIRLSGLSETSGWSRLIVEKPFGRDLASARELNDKLSRTFGEEQIYRIDHYLGKPMVQNLHALSADNPMLKSLWNARHIANVQITASETVGAGERLGYYERSGAVRDMLQNHLLQVLATVAANRGFENGEGRAAKEEVLRALRGFEPAEAAAHVVRGQYGPGESEGQPVLGYRQEDEGVSDSFCDTFIAARLYVDLPAWNKVPFYLRTGKRMARKETRIVIEFKETPDYSWAEIPAKPAVPPLWRSFPASYSRPSAAEKNADFAGNTAVAVASTRDREVLPNLLEIRIEPNLGMSLRLNSKNARTGQVEPINVDFSDRHPETPEAYELLLADAIKGNKEFFANWNEVERSWIAVRPILEAFEENYVPLELYPAGSQGPESAESLLARDGFRWW